MYGGPCHLEPDVEANGRAILFDAGNTLVYADPSRMARIFTGAGWPADEEKVRAAELSARRRLHEAIRDGHVGAEPEVWREYFSSLFEAAGVPHEGRGEVGRRIREVHAVDHLWTAGYLCEQQVLAARERIPTHLFPEPEPVEVMLARTIPLAPGDS